MKSVCLACARLDLWSDLDGSGACDDNLNVLNMYCAFVSGSWESLEWGWIQIGGRIYITRGVLCKREVTKETWRRRVGISAGWLDGWIAGSMHGGRRVLLILNLRVGSGSASYGMARERTSSQAPSYARRSQSETMTRRLTYSQG